ncbi:MAG: PAS domain S-box protein [Thermoplasmatota archaeon]
MMGHKDIFRALFKDSREGMYLTEPNGAFILTNKAFRDIFGYTEDEMEEITAMDLYQDPSSRDVFIQKITAEGSVKDLQIELTTKHEKPLECVLTANAWRTSDGKLKGLYGILRDETGKKKNERILEKTLEEYKTLFNNSLLGVYRTASDGRIILANPALLEMLGFDSLEDLRKRNLERDGFMAQGVRDEFKRVMEERSEVKGFETVWLKKDGSPLVVRENARAVRSRTTGEILYYDGMVEDLTQLKEAERELGLRNTYLETLIDTAPEGIVMTDRSNSVLLVNDEFINTFGYTRDELLGRKVDELISPEDLREESERFTETVLNGESISVETRRVRKDGNTLHVSLKAKPIFHDGEQVANYAIYRDISGRKENEEHIRTLNDTLKSITKILRHDILNDLMIIKQSFQLSSLDGKDRSEMITACVDRSVALINRMRDFETSAIQGKNSGICRIDDLVEEILKGSDLKYEIEKRSVFSVENGLHTVVQNLVVNSINHGKADEIHVLLDENEDGRVIEVADNGVGIPREIRERIFDQGFHHGDSGGTGMGLFLTRSMVEGMGGTIEYRENVPKGAVFRIELPATGTDDQALSGGNRSTNLAPFV